MIKDKIIGMVKMAWEIVDLNILMIKNKFQGIHRGLALLRS